MSLTQSDSQPVKTDYNKNKNLILLVATIIILITIFLAPIIPIQITPTKYPREIEYIPVWHGPLATPMQVDIKNIDLFGGNFYITITWLKHNFINSTEELLDISRQSAFIPSKSTHPFYLPEEWKGVISDDLAAQGYVYSFFL